MCGVIYAQSFDGSSVNKRVLDQYINQIERGVEGFGAFNGKHLVKAAEESRILRWMKKKRNQSDLLLFHHRMPTSTINVRRAAHPFTTKDYFGSTQYVLIHNGGIWNAKDLYTKHQELGMEYHSLLEDMTFNDSEALLWDFALTMEGKQEELTAYGNIAFICMKMVDGKAEKLYFGRNWNKPLKMLRDKTQLFLSSEGEGVDVDVNQLYTYNYALNRLTHKPFTIKSQQYNWTPSKGSSLVPYNSGRASSYSGTTFSSYDDDDDSIWDYTSDPANYDDSLERFDETYMLDGVMWTDVYDEEHFDTYGSWPKYYQRRSTDNTSTVQHVSEIIGAPAVAKLYTLPTMAPSSDEVQTMMFQYLSNARGNFDTAAWLINDAYEKAEEGRLCGERTRNLLLLKEVLRQLESHDDYVDDQSVHYMWASKNLEVV